MGTWKIFVCGARVEEVEAAILLHFWNLSFCGEMTVEVSIKRSEFGAKEDRMFLGFLSFIHSVQFRRAYTWPLTGRGSPVSKRRDEKSRGAVGGGHSVMHIMGLSAY